MLRLQACMKVHKQCLTATATSGIKPSTACKLLACLTTHVGNDRCLGECIADLLQLFIGIRVCAI